MKKQSLLWLGLILFRFSPIYAQDLFLGPGATMSITGGTIVSAKSNITMENSGGISGTGTLLLNGNSIQTLSGSALNLPALSLDNSAGVHVSANKSLTGNLAINQTIITIDSGFSLHVNQNEVTRSSGFVNGVLVKTFTPSNLQKTFEIGHEGKYMPLLLTYDSSSINFEVAAESNSNKITTLPSSLSSSKYIDGHYHIINYNGAPSNYSAQFNFSPTQLIGGAISSNLTATVDTAFNSFTNNYSQSTSTSNSATFNLNNYGRIQLGESGAVVIYLKAILEGYYAGAVPMQSVLFNSGIGNNETLSDSLTLELHSANSPYDLIAINKAVLDTAGNGVFSFINVPSGLYYLVVKHRNHLTTWSASAINCGPNTNYNFTSSSSQAYGGNMKELSNGLFAFYAGDIEKDDFIDGSDFNLILDSLYVSGYLSGDTNGDGFIDGSDFNAILNNIYTGAVNSSSFVGNSNLIKTIRP